jgi:hypothetical protein
MPVQVAAVLAVTAPHQPKQPAKAQQQPQLAPVELAVAAEQLQQRKLEQNQQSTLRKAALAEPAE